MPKKVPSCGPDDADIVIVGEAPGQDEIMHGCPFVGSSGQELRRMLREADLDDQRIKYINVFQDHPPNNDLKKFCLSKKQAEKQYAETLPTLRETEPDYPWPDRYNFGAVSSGAYVHPERLLELPRVEREIRQTDPNVIVPVGNTACWAILGQTGITKLRGTIRDSLRPQGYKTLPTFHPAAILRNWSQRPTAMVDFAKVESESHGATAQQKDRCVLINPTLDEVQDYLEQISTAEHTVACDIETSPTGQFMTCIGFAPLDTEAMVIPFQADGEAHYWSREEETKVLRAIKNFLRSPATKVWQNGVYDIFWLWQVYGMEVYHNEDTMLCHHALQPELPRSLGYLGSVYTDAPEWKSMRKQSAKEND